jgi:DNA-binding NarL/FixJ family response regulator
MMKRIRVLLADDHELVRAGFRTLLQSLGFEVVAEASDGQEAIRLIESHQPDIVLMDISMPGLNGLEATVRVTKAFPHVRTIILSMHKSEQYARRAVRAGAAGYILKEATAAELDLALKSVMRGETYLSPAVMQHIVTDYVRHAGGEPSALEQLTTSQREVLQLIAEGYARKEIARRLAISVKTFDVQRARLMQQLNIHDVAGLVRYAIQNGLVVLDD